MNYSVLVYYTTDIMCGLEKALDVGQLKLYFSISLLEMS